LASFSQKGQQILLKKLLGAKHNNIEMDFYPSIFLAIEALISAIQATNSSTNTASQMVMTVPGQSPQSMVTGELLRHNDYMTAMNTTTVDTMPLIFVSSSPLTSTNSSANNILNATQVGEEKMKW